MDFDLVITGSHVLDPVQGLDARLDIGIRDGRIVVLHPGLSHRSAAQVLDTAYRDWYVVPGLLDIHAHVAYGATTPGIGLECCEPDAVGVRAGVTTLVDAGSVGVANIGVFAAHVIPNCTTRLRCFLNVGRYAHSTPGTADIRAREDVDPELIHLCIKENPGLVTGLKLRLKGDVVRAKGEDIILASKRAAEAHGLPLMVHIGDSTSRGEKDDARLGEILRFLVRTLGKGDIVTHVCTPHAGGFGTLGPDAAELFHEAKSRGITLDGALGLGNFGYSVARRQRAAGLIPDTISSDLTARGAKVHSLAECMAKYMAVGYTFADVVDMVTAKAAAAIGEADHLGSLAPGRRADITILEVVRGSYKFSDTLGESFYGSWGIRPVHTVYGGSLIAPDWGTHSWGWLPESIPSQADDAH